MEKIPWINMGFFKIIIEILMTEFPDCSYLTFSIHFKKTTIYFREKKTLKKHEWNLI